MASAVVTQARVLGALILRETRTRYGQSSLGYLWALTEPIAFVAVLAGIFTAVGRTPPLGNSIVLFFTTGVLPFLLYRNLSNSVGSAIQSNQALLTYPIVKEIDTLAARGVLEVATSLLVMFIMFYALFLMGIATPPVRPYAVIGALAGLSLLGFGMGIINAVIMEHFSSWQNIHALLSRPLFFISGVFFTVDSLPKTVQEIIIWNPILHGVEWLRYGFYMNYRGNSFEPNYLMFWGLGVTLIGLASERVHRQSRS